MINISVKKTPKEYYNVQIFSNTHFFDTNRTTKYIKTTEKCATITVYLLWGHFSATKNLLKKSLCRLTALFSPLLLAAGTAL